ncbi:MAG: hypothetical protein ABIH70_07015 [Chloroflexota bacterium]
MFWKHNETKGNGTKLPGPKEIPDPPARYMIIEMKKDPDWVWKLKGVVHPTPKKEVFYCRVFDEKQAAKAGVIVKDWTSLDDHPELVLWEGYFDKDTFEARPEKFARPAPSSV